MSASRRWGGGATGTKDSGKGSGGQRGGIAFVKMHGAGNDYVYVDAVGTRGMEERFEGPAGRRLIRAMSDRHTGIGGDGVILVCAGAGAREQVRMRMFNADGSEAEMCGNGVRCVAKFAHDRLGVRANPMRVETGRGVLAIGLEVGRGKRGEEVVTGATVDMGKPVVALAKVPVEESGLVRRGTKGLWEIEVGAEGEEIGRKARGEKRREAGRGFASQRWMASFVSMGNPHAVVFERDGKRISEAMLTGLEMERIGPGFERHRAFPKRINAHFVCVGSPRECEVRTWERGTGETQACGTGACAVVVAGVRCGRLERDVKVRVGGGMLRVKWDEGSGRLSLTGPAEEVFEGVWRG